MPHALIPAAPPLEPIQKPAIPDYALLRVIGRGAYGDVWLGRGITGIHRAIKIVWRSRFADAAPFEREFHGLTEFATISLAESRQLALLHVGRNDPGGFFYYVMELADDVATGRQVDPDAYVPCTLREVRERRGRLPVSECISLGVDLAQGLAFLHRCNLVHRDIKPSNIILVDGRPKLADIGLVSAADDVTTFVGTEGFIAPEGPGTPASDIFSLGKVLYELSTGLDRKRFPSLPELAANSAETAAFLRFNEVLLRACEPSLTARYATAGQMLEDLRALQSVGRVKRRPRGIRRRLAPMMLAGLAVTATAILWRKAQPPVAIETGAPAPVTSPDAIAVLPFAIAGGDPELRVFADGLQEDLLTNLSQIAGLRVISSRSAKLVAATTTSTPDAAKVLGVTRLVEGSVRLENNRVRVSIQITDARDDVQLWREMYDRIFTEAFDLQSDISIEVAKQLRAKLSAGLLAEFKKGQNRHPTAKQLYDRARAALNDADQEAAGTALALSDLEASVALDPAFSDAWALLSTLHTLHFAWGLDRTDRRLEQAYRAARKAVEIAPLSPAANVALGDYFFRGRQDFGVAQRYYRQVLQQNPSHAECMANLANIARRQGRWEDSSQLYRQALQLNPVDPLVIYNAADTLLRMRRFEQAYATMQAAFARSPENPILKQLHGELLLLWKGDLQGIRHDLATRKPGLPTPQFHITQTIEWLALERRFDEALRALLESSFDVEEGQLVFNTRDSLEAELHFLAGNAPAAKQAAERAIVAVAALRERRPKDPRLAALLGQMYAIAGDAAAVRREVERPFTAECGPVDAYDRGVFLHAKIIGLARSGQAREALDVLRGALQEPGWITPAFVRASPAYDVLRGAELDAILAASPSMHTQPSSK